MRAEMTRAMTADPGLVMQFDEPPLSALLSPQEARLADEALSGLGLSLALVDRFRPWAVFLLTAMPSCAMLEIAETGRKGLDERIIALAREAGAEVRSLETFLELIDILTPETPEGVREMVVATVGVAREAEARLHDTRALFSAGEIGAIWVLAGSDLRKLKLLEDPDAVMHRFWETLVAARNRSMLKRAAPELERGGVVMAVRCTCRATTAWSSSCATAASRSTGRTEAPRPPGRLALRRKRRRRYAERILTGRQ